MKPFVLSSPVVLFTHSEHGTRLLFKNGVTNPRDELGKNGVTFHNWFSSFFYNTIPVQATLIDEKGEHKNQTFYINRNSLVKYLGNKAKPDCTNEQLLEVLETTFWSKDNNSADLGQRAEQSRAGKDGLRHAGRHNRIGLTGWFSGVRDYLKATFLGWLYQVTIGSLTRLAARFLFVSTEQNVLDAGEVLAKRRFQQAYASVPAYKAHITRFNGKEVMTEFRDIPVTTKDNYIKYQQYDSDTHFYGKYPQRSKTDTSTGTTGKPTEWVRGEDELQAVKKSLQLAAKIQFGDRPVSYINAFALGPWATGLTTYELMRETGSVFATGPDKDKILDKLLSIAKYEAHQLDLAVEEFTVNHPLRADQKELLSKTIASVLKALVNNKELSLKEEVFKQFYEAGSQGHLLMDRHRNQILAMVERLNTEKQQVVIAGYPPFLKDLAAFIKEKGHDLKDFSVVGVVGGQGISEAMRDQLVMHGFTKIYSSYGASDLDINLGVESDYEIVVRKAIEKNPGLARELFGENKGLPMVFHYDPMNYHVEADDEDELIFTGTRTDRSSPRIRYDLGDKGRVYASSDVQALLTKYGIFQKPKTNLPLMFVWGRDSTVVFHGANLAFTELERAVTDDSDLESMVLKKAFYTYEDEEGVEQLEIWLELNENIELPDEDAAKEHAHHLLNALALMNQDFRYQLANLGDGTPLPAVRFFKRGESPISEAGGHRKQVLIFQKGVNLPEGYQFPDAEKCISAVLPMSGEITQPRAQATI